MLPWNLLRKFKIGKHSKTCQEARTAVFKYVEIFYNRQELHKKSINEIVYEKDRNNEFNMSNLLAKCQ